MSSEDPPPAAAAAAATTAEGPRRSSRTAYNVPSTPEPPRVPPLTPATPATTTAAAAAKPRPQESPEKALLSQLIENPAGVLWESDLGAVSTAVNWRESYCIARVVSYRSVCRVVSRLCVSHRVVRIVPCRIDSVSSRVPPSRGLPPSEMVSPHANHEIRAPGRGGVHSFSTFLTCCLLEPDTRIRSKLAATRLGEFLASRHVGRSEHPPPVRWCR